MNDRVLASTSSRTPHSVLGPDTHRGFEPPTPRETETISLPRHRRPVSELFVFAVTVQVVTEEVMTGGEIDDRGAVVQSSAGYRQLLQQGSTSADDVQPVATVVPENEEQGEEMMMRLVINSSYGSVNCRLQEQYFLLLFNAMLIC